MRNKAYCQLFGIGFFVGVSGVAIVNDAIDIVILWVEGSDPAWLEEKEKWRNVQYIIVAGFERKEKCVVIMDNIKL